VDINQVVCEKNKWVDKNKNAVFGGGDVEGEEVSHNDAALPRKPVTIPRCERAWRKG